MKIILETERLFLREFIPNDGIHFFNLNNDPKVIKYTGNIAFCSIDEANEFVKNYSDYKRNGYGRWAVCLKSNNEFIGWCGLKLENKEVDLGFRFFRKNWGFGYATESAKACLEYGFRELNINRIIGRAYINNKASINVLIKCNFLLEKEFIYDNKLSVLYSINYD